MNHHVIDLLMNNKLRNMESCGNRSIPVTVYRFYNDMFDQQIKRELWLRNKTPLDKGIESIE